ncbi:hypothetical protein WDW37_16425 [Bdellovibrionota bacterium FG-1]
MSKKKEFDCVEMKHKIQEQIYEETKNMSWEQEREHRRKNIETGPFVQKWKAIQEQQAKKKKAS